MVAKNGKIGVDVYGVKWDMILGIDPGWNNIGYALIEDNKLIRCGVIKQKDEIRRLLEIDEAVEKIIRKHGVRTVAVETIFFAKNARSAMKVAEVIGVIRLAVLRCGADVTGYTPLQVKMALVGYGRAEKEQVEMMVRSELGLTRAIRPSHAADAAAVALTERFTMNDKSS